MSVDYGGTHENTGQHGSSSQFASFSDHIDNRACYFCLDLHALIVGRRYPMLKAKSEEVKLSYEHAREAERRADNARTPADREFWLTHKKDGSVWQPMPNIESKLPLLLQTSSSGTGDLSAHRVMLQCV